MIDPLYCALMRFYLEYSTQAWDLHHRKDIELLEGHRD